MITKRILDGLTVYMFTGLNVVTSTRKRKKEEQVAELEKLVLYVCSMPTEIKEFTSNGEVSKAVAFRVTSGLWLNLLLPTDFWGLLHVICHHDVTAGLWLCPSMEIR